MHKRDSKSKYSHRRKVREWKRVSHANRNENKARVAIFLSDKIDKTKTVTRGEEKNCIMIKGSIQEGELTFINMYVPNMST